MYRTVAAMHKMKINDDGAMSIGDRGCRMLCLLAGVDMAIPNFGYLHWIEAQVHLYLEKERKRFRALATKMLEAGEIPALASRLARSISRSWGSGRPSHSCGGGWPGSLSW